MLEIAKRSTRPKNRALFLCYLTLCSVLLSSVSCDAPAEFQSNKTGRLKVTCTVGMLGDMVEHIAGIHAEITTLMGPGTDPHLFKPKPSHRHALRNSDLILYCGNHLEAQMTTALKQYGKEVSAVAVAEGFSSKQLLVGEKDATTVDPHLWFDLKLWQRVALRATEELSKIDPENADYYRQRAASYVEKMAALHQRIRKEIATIPKAQRVMITAHDAFRYFGRAYDIEVMGIQGMSTEDSASLNRINHLVEFIVKRKIKAIFVESTISKDNVLALIEGCQAKGHELKIGGELFSDAMGAAGTKTGTYLGMVEHNLEVIVGALK